MRLTISLLLAVAIAVLSTERLHARDLESIRHSGQLIVCANKNAMPVSGKGSAPGYQLEIAAEVAKEIDVGLTIEWIWNGYQARYTDCDMILGVARDPKPGGFLRYMQALSDVEVLLVFSGEVRDVGTDDLRGKIVAVPSASLANFALLEIGAEPRVAYRSDVAILDAIVDGTLDGGVVSNLTLNWYRQLYPDVTLFALSTDLLEVTSRYPMTIGLRHTDSLGEADFQEILEGLRDDGRLAEILARYGQILSADFDDPNARVPQEISEPQAVTTRKDIVRELEERVENRRKKTIDEEIQEKSK